MNEISVIQSMQSSPADCFSVLKREIGLKTNCTPFAAKLITSLKTLDLKTKDQEILAANTLLAGLQTLSQGGINAEDYDKIDFVKRGNTIVPSARVEAFLRACARKGYRITDTIVAVPKEDKDTTFFKENFYNGEIVYTLEDRRFNADRAVTPERLVGGYFWKFICRLDIHEVKTGKRLAMTVCEMTDEEVIAVSKASEQGLFKSRWEEYNTRYGVKKRKVVTNELNTDTFWVKWCGEMVNKTIIRRALKRIKEVLPELQESIYAFEADEATPTEAMPEIEIEIPEIVEPNVELSNMTAEEKADCAEMFEIYVANPQLAENDFAEVKELISQGVPAQEIVNKHYAKLDALSRSKAKWSEIGGYFRC